MAQTVTEGYSAKQIANYFLSKYMDTGITPLKLQKLVYIAHGWYLAFLDKPLVSDENAEAWQYGPVYPSLYYHFRDRGNLAIDRLAEKKSILGRNKGFLNSRYKKTIPKIPLDHELTVSLLERIWEVYGGNSGIYLSNLCHQPGTPWDKTRKRTNIRNAHIANNLIKDHYKTLLKENQ
ncbi:MAG: DUF4065 domain-containing protein [Rhodobacteraceae bacterium]|nr:DUF4065 domain-containing protein [Paracoccaceae bacterium]